MSTARFEIDAKLPPGANTDQIPEMFQALLEERFKLTWRRETKEMGFTSAVTITAPSASILTLVGVTSRFTGRPVVDETGIEGQYDFSLTFAPEVTTGLQAAPPNGPAEVSDPAPTLSDAVKKYGLRIASRKAPIDMFVLTHIERTSTEN
jgi:uncharacterized protein (TIGR03435 family)